VTTFDGLTILDERARNLLNVVLAAWLFGDHAAIKRAVEGRPADAAPFTDL
jgi:hypothetical protein